jgi:hypothetical protein
LGVDLTLAARLDGDAAVFEVRQVNTKFTLALDELELCGLLVW